MKIQLNGHEREFAAPLSLSKLVEQLGMKEDRVAVELNRNIVPRDKWSQTALSEGDRLEVVHFVGGGSNLPNLRFSPMLRTAIQGFRHASDSSRNRVPPE
jgi:sulfur carrier protein